MSVTHRFLRAATVVGAILWVLYMLVRLDCREAVPLLDWKISLGVAIAAITVFVWHVLYDPREELSWNNILALVFCGLVWVVAAVLVGAFGKSTWFYPTMITATVLGIVVGGIWTDAEPPLVVDENGHILYSTELDN